MRHPQHTRLILLSMLLTLLFSMGGIHAEQDLKTTIEAADQKWMQAFNQQDSAAVAALYTADGQLFPTHSNIVEGTEAIAQFWQSVFDAGIQQAKLTTIEVEGQDDTAYEVGTYTLVGNDDEVLDTGKYIVIWKHDQGQWKLHRDIWNTNMPAPEQ
jgi:uncharacterized protein (TIGR02246 family)